MKGPDQQRHSGIIPGLPAQIYHSFNRAVTLDETKRHAGI